MPATNGHIINRASVKKQLATLRQQANPNAPAPRVSAAHLDRLEAELLALLKRHIHLNGSRPTLTDALFELKKLNGNGD